MRRVNNARRRAPIQAGLLLLATLAAPTNAHDKLDDGTPDPAALRLASVHAVVADLDSDKTLFRKNADRVVPIASITKVMSAIVVLESGQPMDEWLTVFERDRAAANHAHSRIRIGSRLTRADLLLITLTSSANRAIYTLARHYPLGIDAFVAAMNRKARELGMANSHFVEPTGLDPANRANASDLLKLLRAAAGYDAIRRYTSTIHFVARFKNPNYQLGYGNTNLLVHKRGWDIELSKTGYLNEAGRCLMVIASIDGRRLGIVLLDSFGSLSPVGDVGRIKQWLQTGHGGRVAAAARRYEARKAKAYQQAERSETFKLPAFARMAEPLPSNSTEIAAGGPAQVIQIPSRHVRADNGQ